MSIIQRVPWTVQPQSLVRVNWGNPLARGLVAAVPGNGLFYDSVKSRPVTPEGGLVFVNASRQGIGNFKAFAFDGSDDGIDAGAMSTLTTHTLCAWVYVSSSGGNVYRSFMSRGGAFENDSWFSFGIRSNASNAAPFIYARSGGTLTGFELVNLSQGWHRMVATCDASGTREIFSDGVSIGSAGGVLGTDGGQNFRIGRDTTVGTTARFNQPVSDVRVYSIVWSKAEVENDYRNPWQLFAPQTRRIWVPVSAGGGTTIAGALGTAVASGLTATIGANTGIAGALGTAVASGLTATIGANTGIAGALGTAVASGLTGTVSNSTDTTITGALGTATASGFTATVDANRTIAGALGTATASGLQGTVSNSNDTVIGGTLGIAVASGLLGTVAWNRTIEGALGTAVASGLQGTVSTAGALTDAEFRQMYDWLSELHLIHGLRSGSPMTVTPTTRVAGAVSQTIGEVSTTITVTRV